MLKGDMPTPSFCYLLPPSSFCTSAPFLAPPFIDLFLTKSISISRDKINYVKPIMSTIASWLCECSAMGRKRFMKVLPCGMPSGEAVQPNMRKCEL